MKKTLQIIFPILILLSACAPKVQDRKFPEPKESFGPRFQDTDLSQDLKQSDLFVADLSWKGTVTTSTFFHQAQYMIRLADITHNALLSQKAFSWVRSFYAQPAMTSSMQFGQSPFVMLATTQTQGEVQGALKDIHADLQNAQQTVKDKIITISKEFPFNTSGQNLLRNLAQGEAYNNFLLKNLHRLGMSTEIEGGVRDELVKQTGSMFTSLHDLAPQFYITKTFSGSLKLIDTALTQLQVQMPAELQKSFAQGKVLAAELDGMDDAQGALTVLVDIWKILEPKERQEDFQPASDALYNFLSKQDDDALNCLRKPGCNGGLFKGIAKKLFILPQLDKYGIGKLKQDLNAKTLAYVITQVEAFAQNFVVTLPQTFGDQIAQGLAQKDQELQGIQKDYPEYLKTLLGDWSKKSLNKTQGQVAGFEVSSIQLETSNKAPIKLTPAASPLDLDARTAGASLGINALWMDYLVNDDSLGLPRALSQVNKLITIGGYRDDQNNLIPALLSPVEAVKSPLDVTDYANASTHISYRIPDRIRLLDSFHADDKTAYDKTFSAAGFAEQIEGLSLMLRQTADWKPSGFDKLLGAIQAQDLTTEIQADALKRPLFPKDSFFALNLGDVAVLLKDITKMATPVFLVTLNKNVIWADQYDSNGSETAIMGGIVDIVEGKKSNVVNSEDVAKFLISLTEFLKATEGAENTKSSILLEKDKTGSSPLDALKEGRDDVKMLVVALANFISNQLASDESSLIQDKYYLQELQKSNNPAFKVEVQSYAIRALLAAYEITQIEAYKNAALETYYSMNKSLYSGAEHFYINGDGSKLTTPAKVHTLLAIQELRPYLPMDSQKQLDKISAPWISALQKLL